MKALTNYINESVINEGFKDFLRNLYDTVTGKKQRQARAEYDRRSKEELEERQLNLKDAKDKFFTTLKNGTEKYDVLSISYKYTSFTRKHYYGDSINDVDSWKLLVLCDKNTMENAESCYETSNGDKSHWAYMNAYSDANTQKNGFKILFKPIYEKGKLLATSFTDGKLRVPLIYLFDVESVKLNDKQDIDEIIDVLKNKPRDFYGGNIDGIVDILKTKK